MATSQWPKDATALYQQGAKIPGTLRLCTKSLFFDPEDVRLPIIRSRLPLTPLPAAVLHTGRSSQGLPAHSRSSSLTSNQLLHVLLSPLAPGRLPFAHAQQLDAESTSTFTFVSSLVVKMKANMADAPYTFEKAAPSAWQFSLSYASLDTFLPQAHQCLAASRLPCAERDLALTVRPLWRSVCCTLQECNEEDTPQALSLAPRDLLCLPCKIAVSCSSAQASRPLHTTSSFASQASVMATRHDWHRHPAAAQAPFPLFMRSCRPLAC